MRPFSEGMKAFKGGRLDNPYKKDTKDYADWEYGFNRAYFQNLEKLSGRGSTQVQSDKKKNTYASA